MITEDEKELILQLLSEGQSFAMACASINKTRLDLIRLLKDDRDFAAAVDEAKSVGYDELADGLLSIHTDESLDAQRLGLYSANLKWVLARRKPAEYGDKIEVKQNVSLDLGQALAEAKLRREREVIELQDSGQDNATEALDALLTRGSSNDA